MNIPKSCFFLCIVLISSTQAFTSLENQKLKQLKDYCLSQDKEFILHSIKQWDETEKKSKTWLAYTHISSKQSQNLTNPDFGQHDSSPLISKRFPNRIFFLSTRSGSSQIWHIDFLPGKQFEPKQLTFYSIDIHNLKMSRNGNILAFTAEIYLECDDFDCTKSKDKEKEGQKWKVYDQLFVRHWDQWLTDKVEHVFVQPLDDSDPQRPKLRDQPNDVMSGMNTNCPVPPSGGSEHFDLNREGTQVVFTGQDRTKDEALNTGWKTYLSLIGTQTTLHLTAHTKARTQQPQFSPNDLNIAYLAMNKTNSESDRLQIYVYNSLNETHLSITTQIDKSILEFTWLTDKIIMFTAIEYGVQKLYQIDIETKQFSLFFDTNSYAAYAPRVIDQDKIVLIADSFAHPKDIFIGQKGKIEQITDLNPQLAKFPEPLPFNFPNNDNEIIQGWVFPPTDYYNHLNEKGEFLKGSIKYPFAMLIHGGPESPWISNWSYRWNPHLFTQKYAVVMINPHGSPGVSQNFTDSVINNWGGTPFQDLMAGFLNLRSFNFINLQQGCALGASYGGYMVNWIQGNTDRFKCLVTHDGVFDIEMSYWGGDELWFGGREFCGREEGDCRPDIDPLGFQQWNPKNLVKNFKTPHLVVHGGRDYRLPETQGIGMFTALQVKGVPSRLMYFPEENHWVLDPMNQVKWYEEVLGWLDKWTGQEIDK